MTPLRRARSRGGDVVSGECQHRVAGGARFRPSSRRWARTAPWPDLDFSGVPRLRTTRRTPRFIYLIRVFKTPVKFKASEMGIRGKVNKIADIPTQTAVFSVTARGSDIPRVYDRGAARRRRPQRAPRASCAGSWPWRPQQAPPGAVGVPSAGTRGKATGTCDRRRQAALPGGRDGWRHWEHSGLGPRRAGELGCCRPGGCPVPSFSLVTDSPGRLPWSAGRARSREAPSLGGSSPGGASGSASECAGADGQKRGRCRRRGSPSRRVSALPPPGVPPSGRGAHEDVCAGAPQGDTERAPRDVL